MNSKVRKYSIFLSVVFLLFFPFTSVKAGLEQLDQHAEDQNQLCLIEGSGLHLQTFKPALSFMTRVSVNISAGAGNFMNYRIYSTAKGETISWGNISVPGGTHWVDLAVNKEVTPETQHSIILSSSSTDHDISWNMGDNVYSRGYLICNSTTHYDRDYMFRSYGYNKLIGEKPPYYYVPPDGETVIPGDGDTLAGGKDSTAKLGQEPAEQIDSSIVTPSNLQISDESDQELGKAKLTWSGSTTTDIDGYRIFAKTEPHNYALIKEVDKDISEYLDAPLQFGTEYKYIVRAYRNDKESASSNEVSITPQKPETAKTPFDWLSNIYLWLIPSGLAILALIIWYLVQRKKKKKEEKNINK
jgi:hypothetical protein